MTAQSSLLLCISSQLLPSRYLNAHQKKNGLFNFTLFDQRSGKMEQNFERGKYKHERKNWFAKEQTKQIINSRQAAKERFLIVATFTYLCLWSRVFFSLQYFPIPTRIKHNFSSRYSLRNFLVFTSGGFGFQFSERRKVINWLFIERIICQHRSFLRVALSPARLHFSSVNVVRCTHVVSTILL